MRTWKKAESLTNNKKDLMYIYGDIGKILYKMDRINDALSYLKKV
jgi:hypothetical protein